MGSDQDPFIQEFVEIVAHNDDLAAVLRLQLFIERSIDRLLVLHHPDSDLQPVLDELTFMQKVRIARRYDLIQKADVTALQAIAELRNQFAHNLSRALSEEDNARMKGALKGHLKSINDIFATNLRKRKIVRRAGFDALIAISAVNLHLHHRWLQKALELDKARPDLGPPTVDVPLEPP